MKEMKFILIGILLLGIAFADDNLFYSGNLVVKSVSADIIIDEKAQVSAEYSIENIGSASESATISYDGNNQTISLAAGEKKTISIAYSINVSGLDSKTLSYNPAIKFNGKPNGKRVDALLVKAVLPNNIKSILSSSKQPDSSGKEGGRTYYTFSSSDSYPTIITLKWTTLAVEVVLEKSVSPSEIDKANETITIKINVENKGAQQETITLVDDFSAGDFEPISPKEEFSIPSSSDNTTDPRIQWKKNVTLSSGEKKTLSYSMKYIGDVSSTYGMEIKPTTARIGGVAVAISNSVSIMKKAPGTEVIKTIETTIIEPQKIAQNDTNKTTIPGEEQKTEEKTQGGSDLTNLAIMGLGLLVALIIIAFVASKFLFKGKGKGRGRKKDKEAPEEKKARKPRTSKEKKQGAQEGAGAGTTGAATAPASSATSGAKESESSAAQEEAQKKEEKEPEELGGPEEEARKTMENEEQADGEEEGKSA